MSCVTHHYACDCREAAHAETIAQFRRDLEAMTLSRDEWKRASDWRHDELFAAKGRIAELEKANEAAYQDALGAVAEAKRYREALEYWNRWSTGGNFDGKEAERLTKAALSATPPTRTAVYKENLARLNPPPRRAECGCGLDEHEFDCHLATPPTREEEPKKHCPCGTDDCGFEDDGDPGMLSDE